MMLSFMLVMAAATNELQAIENAYTEAEFELVSSLVAKQENKPFAPEQKKRMFELGAFAEFFLGHEKRAARYFELMFRADPQASIDERRYPPKAVAFYKQQRERLGKPAAAPPPPAPAKAGFRPVTLIPFGIGHLIVGDIPAGIVFMAIPAVLIATSITLYWVRQAQRLPGDQYANANAASAMQIVQNVAAFAAIGVTLYGVIDCVLFAQDRVAARRNRISVAPMGAGLSLAIEY